uniref:Uncharacterized protein n=1 Tax=Arundo donax TaxID=35708 RepID=A0A0A9ELF3_ARUDO
MTKLCSHKQQLVNIILFWGQPNLHFFLRFDCGDACYTCYLCHASTKVFTLF